MPPTRVTGSTIAFVNDTVGNLIQITKLDRWTQPIERGGRVAVDHLNPKSLHRSPAFSQGTVIKPGSTIVIVGGQNGVGPDGTIVGDGIVAQTEQAMRNLLAVLKEAGAGPADVAKLTIYFVEGVDVNEAYAASRSVWGDHPTAISGMFVQGLGVPGALVEVDAIAAIAG